MPIFDFHCRDCGAGYEMLVRNNDGIGAVSSCPNCGSTNTERQISRFNMARASASGDGGSTCCGRETRCDRPPCSGGGGCHRG